MVRLAIVGMGYMGCQYARMLLDGSVFGAEICGITRIRPERLQHLQEITERKIPIYSSATELFEAIRTGKLIADGVLIVTPQRLHEEQVTEALRLGVHVLCDKPAGTCSGQARRMQEAAVASGRLYSMMFQQRMNPVYARMKEIVERKRYGEMKRVSWVMTDWYRPDGYYNSVSGRGTWETDGGGILLNQCPHNLDLLQWICGMPVRVQSFCKEGKYHNIEVEDEVTAYLEFANGATGTFYSTTGEAPGRNRLEISMEDALLICEDGKLTIEELGFSEANYRKKATDYFVRLRGNRKELSGLGEDTGYIGVLQNFADTIAGEAKLAIEGAEGCKSLLLSNAMYLSSWQKQMVEIPQTREEMLRFEKEFEREYRGKIG